MPKQPSHTDRMNTTEELCWVLVRLFGFHQVSAIMPKPGIHGVADVLPFLHRVLRGHSCHTAHYPGHRGLFIPDALSAIIQTCHLFVDTKDKTVSCKWHECCTEALCIWWISGKVRCSLPKELIWQLIDL
mmetsp:Transcript_32095/g.67296  ORF Transcript_32095/g.67296 Transcript_32095/m.67296 type:complete len:130 (+) Transcript_32095:247-636(+)